MPTTLSGPQKAAMLLVQLGKERTAQVLRSMGQREVEALMAEVARLDEVHDDVMQNVMSEFVAAASSRLRSTQGGMGFVRDVLAEGLGDDRAQEILQRIGPSSRPFEFVRSMDPRQVLTFVGDEHPQTIALMLAHLEPDDAAGLLAALPPDVGGEVARRIAVMERPEEEVVRHVESLLMQKMAAFAHAAESAPAGGVQPLVDILNRSTPEVERAILEQLDRVNPDLAQEVRRKLFIFEDIVKLEDRAVQLLLREVDTHDLAVALKGVSEAVTQKVLGNLSERAAGNLTEEIDLLGPTRMQAVEEARESIVAAIRSLEESGQIVVSRGGDDFV